MQPRRVPTSRPRSRPARQPGAPKKASTKVSGDVIDAAVHAPPVAAVGLPPDWEAALADELAAPYFAELLDFVAREREQSVVYPPPELVFAALEATPLAKVSVVLLGQDPYHGPGQAHGLAFSVPPDMPPPPSLRNLFRELVDDLGVPEPQSGCLTSWASQGVLLLNTVLTVRAGEAGSHRGHGWEKFTDAIIRIVSQKAEPAVFLLLGSPAQAKIPLVDTTKNAVLSSAHPSPLSAHRGFFGSRPFSATNAELVRLGRPPIDWSIPE